MKISGKGDFTTTLYATARITKNASNILTKILFVGIMTNCLLRNKKDGICRLFLCYENKNIFLLGDEGPIPRRPYEKMFLKRI